MKWIILEAPARDPKLSEVASSQPGFPLPQIASVTDGPPLTCLCLARWTNKNSITMKLLLRNNAAE